MDAAVTIKHFYFRFYADVKALPPATDKELNESLLYISDVSAKSNCIVRLESKLNIPSYNLEGASTTWTEWIR